MKRHPGAHVRANFGQTPFVFDIDTMMAVSFLSFQFRCPPADNQQNEQMIVEKEISQARTTSLRARLDENNLIQELVAQFLAHDGYVETAKAFAKERKAESRALSKVNDEASEDSEIEEDVDAINRQSMYGLAKLFLC